MVKKITFALLSLLLVPLGMMAQNVTVHPDNGSMMPALKSGNTDTFYEWGGFATWKHEQLSLTITTGDSDNNLTGTNDQLTGSGQLAKPANNIFAGEGVTYNYYITYVSGGTTYYLNTEGKFVTDSKTEWETNNYNEVHSGDVYLYYRTSGNTRYLTVTTYSALGQNFGVRVDNDNHLYVVGNNRYYYLTGNATGDTPTMTTNQSELAEWTEEVTNTNNLQIGKGRSSKVNGQGVGLDTYITFSLPKGYRFTGYTIIFHRISRPDSKTTSDTSDPVYEWTGNINFGETDNTFTYTNASGTYKGGIGQSNRTKYTLTRTSDTDMGNVLYFKLDNGRQYTDYTGRAFIQLDHVELYFTAENDAQSKLPSIATGTNQSAINIPFATSKIDYGELVMRDINGKKQGEDGYNTGDAANTARVSYDGTLRDMNANMILYEDGSVSKDDVDNGFDGTEGKIVDYHSGSISVAGDYIVLDPMNHNLLTEDGEAIYYIESPIWAENTAAGVNAHKNPIGYRIVSAKFTCAPGTGGVYLPATFKIQYKSEGHGPNEDGTYGLNTYSGTYNWNPSYHTVWRIDHEGYIYGSVSYDGSIRYLAYGVDQQGNDNFIMTTEKPSEANGTFEITENNQIRLKSNTNLYIGWRETVDGKYIYNGEENDNVTRYFEIAADEAHRSTYHQVTAASESSSGAYTFKIYKPDGTTVEETIDGTVGGTKTVYGYNNDAIKIGVTGGTALITAEITMQALDPYIDRLDVVCQENGGTGGRVTQTFNATDFSVKGAPFTFYVPMSFQGNAKFTFENLYSDYGDETYYGNTSSTNHARYFFVESPYEKTAANVYDRNNEADYTTKIYTDQRGDKKFVFNNASKFEDSSTASSGYYEEYAFNKSIYTKSTAQGGTGGTFSDLTFNSTSEMNGNTEKTAYLFTCDEPRYNIAPTTATQHVYYAFYEMKIKMTKMDYSPILTWNKIYESSFEGNGKTDSKWGLTLTTTSVTDDQGTHSGYLTVNQILTGIANRTADNTAAPKNTDQILYIDGSNLMSIVDQPTTSTVNGQTVYTSQLPSLKQNLDKNALIYLPYGSKPSLDNFAYNTIYQYQQTPIFRAAKDIVLTDKYAFYAPYDIQVGAENSAKYTRQITKSTYKDEAYATVIMPFEIELKNGKHVDDYGTLEFLQMNTNNATADDYNYIGKAVFFSTTDAEKVEANTPYALHATQNGVENGVFIVDQPGARIVATPNDAKSSSNSLFSATEITSTGNLTDKNNNKSKYTFSHKGSFSGYKIPKDNPKTFYFANNGFYSSAELNSNYSTVDLLPFRSVYEVTNIEGGGNAKVGFLRFVEGENDSETDGIDVLKSASELDMNAPVYDLQGRMIAPTYREVVGKNLSSGIYVVNGVKIIVK